MPPADLTAALRVHALGPSQGHSGVGPVRYADDGCQAARNAPYRRKAARPPAADAALVERARRMTPEEIRQMRDEMDIRREIALRDARLLADWTAMKRRELELQEARIRQFIRAEESRSGHPEDAFEEYIKLMESAL
ncbi:hypothetical protein H4R19_006294 [Coemansia spiralis]|nr:hypothetical protein H4R19_006294 [Coemansia spiralis]